MIESDLDLLELRLCVRQECWDSLLGLSAQTLHLTIAFLLERACTRFTCLSLPDRNGLATT